MSEITNAIKAKQTQIRQLQSDIDTLQSAATILGGARAKAKPKQKSKQKSQAKRKLKQKAKSKPKHQWSAADRAAISKRMKASWAKRKK